MIVDIAFLCAAFLLGIPFGYGLCLLRRAGWASPEEVEEIVTDAINEAFGG
jgi:hypothetical protein